MLLLRLRGLDLFVVGGSIKIETNDAKESPLEV